MDSSPFVKRSQTIVQRSMVKNIEESDLVPETVCPLCKHILMEPKECSSCKQAWCTPCLDEWQSHGPINCPNGCTSYQLGPIHPMLRRTLESLEVDCPNKERGCTVNTTYKDLQSHIKKCEYEKVKCLNFGCSQPFQRKDYKAHQAECKYKVSRCEKCEIVLDNDQELEDHDCIKSLTGRFEALESITLALKNKVKEE